MRITTRFLPVLLVCCVAACGGAPGDTPDLGTVSGIVTIDGKPTAGVNVMFTPTGEGRPSSGITDSNGKYELIFSTSSMGAMVGEHKVTISGASGGAEDWEEEFSNSSNTATAVIPEEYTKAEKRFEVKSGSNEIDLTYP